MEASAGSSGDRTLTLLHLRKVFSDYCKVTLSASSSSSAGSAAGQHDGDRKFDKVLPLFGRVMSMYKPEELIVNFKELCLFTSHLCRILVQEIRIRASNQSTEQAAELIAKYLQPDCGESKGWMLLSSLRYISSSGSPPVVETMCKASLPSTLSKALYLFFDLPLVTEPSEIDRRKRLFDAFSQLLELLCTFKSVGEELAKKDDLFLIFMGASCVCMEHNILWRKAASQMLLNLLAKGISTTVVKYVHNKECIRQYLNNVLNDEQQRIPVPQLSEMLITLMCLLKDSGSITNVLLQDFMEANGYLLIRDFILKNEQDEDMVRNILFMLISLVTAGTTVLLPASQSANLFTLETFQMPQPSGNGLSVRNLDAFNLLVQMFIQGKNDYVASTVADVVQNIYSCDAVNYFILDKDYPLSQFIEHMDDKPTPIQVKLLELVEYSVFQLNHVPCKELIAMSVLLKTQTVAGNIPCCIVCLQSAFRVLSANPVFKDVFRDVGLVETFSWIFHHFLDTVRIRPLQETETRLCLLTTDFLTVLVKGNAANAQLLGDLNRSQMLDLVALDKGEWRDSVLHLIKQLLLVSKSDQYLTSLLQLIVQSTKSIELNTVLLRSLLCVLRESHKIRISFRRTGGYLTIMSLLSNLEGQLQSHVDDGSPTMAEEKMEILEFINLILKVVTISMRFEPSNARYFFSEIKWDSLSWVIRLTGCFNHCMEIDVSDPKWACSSVDSLAKELKACHKVFKMEDSISKGDLPDGMPTSVFCACYILRLIFNMALDNYENGCEALSITDDEGLRSDNETSQFSVISWKRNVLVHPGAILSVLNLLPSIFSAESSWACAAHFYTSLVLKAILRCERNQQIMCQVDMPRALLTIGAKLFKVNNHLLLTTFYYMFERLSCQQMYPREFRHFLRLDAPLCCRNLDDDDEVNVEKLEVQGGPMPLSRVKALVSMLTPRDHRLAQSPSFVEFDMSVEGFAVLFIPSLAPAEASGVGSGERIFPPLNGLTFSSWIYIEELSDKRIDPHPIRLLTITRTINSDGPDRKGRNSVHLACLTIQISPIDRSLLISTAEHDVAGVDLEEVKGSGENVCRVALADVIILNQWTHISVVLTRAVLKHSHIAVYLNGALIHADKLHYILPNAGGAAANLAQTQGVHAMVGTPPGLRRPSRLRWKLSSMHLIEDSLNQDAIRLIHNLHPYYIGNFQTVGVEGGPLVPEEKVAFSLSASSTSELTLYKIRSMYSKRDSELISALLGISVHDNTTPLRVVPNGVLHANGTARSFGAVIMGYLGMRTFSPCPVSRLIESVGGSAPLFGLIVMATDSQELYASLKALVSAVKANSSLYTSMNNTRAYQTVAMLLEEKCHLMNSHILHLVLSLVGTLDTSKEMVAIPNITAFEDLLCDLDVWRNAPADIHRLLYEHFYELLTDQRKENLTVIRNAPLLSRILYTLFDQPQLIKTTNDIVFNLLSAVMQPLTDRHSLLKVGQFIAATLPLKGDDNETKYPFQMADLLPDVLNTSYDDQIPTTAYLIYVRNRLLNMIANFLAHSNPQLYLQMSEQIVRVLGFDWIMALFSPGVHPCTIFIGFRILLSILHHDHLMVKFKDGTANGGWLTDADSIVRNRVAVLLGFSVSDHGGAVGSHIDINPELSNSEGFAVLEHLLSAHADKPICYMSILALLVGQPSIQCRYTDVFTMDLIWSHVFGLSVSNSVSEAVSNVQICPDALIPLFAMVRAGIFYENENGRVADNHWSKSHPLTVLLFINFLYQNSVPFFHVCQTEDVVSLLFSVLIPESVNHSTAGTPDQPFMDAFGKNLQQTVTRSVMDLMKNILFNDIYTTSGSKNETLFDALIENVAENGRLRRCQCVVFSEIAVQFMDHIMLSDICASTSSMINAPPSYPPSVPCQPILGSVFARLLYISSRLVDAVWSGLYVSEPITILQFLLKVAKSLRRADSKSAWESMYNSISRVVLFLLSRPIDSVTVQMSVLDTLTECVQNQRIVFNPNFNDPLFYGSLVHLIFMLSVTPDINADDGLQGQLNRASAQVAMYATRLWQELCHSKRNVLEEIFKTGFVVEINAARALLSHLAGQYWSQFVDSQVQTNSQNNFAQIQQQIQSKISKMANGLQRFTGKRSLMLSTSVSPSFSLRRLKISSDVVHMWIRVHTSLLRELVRAQCHRYHEWHSHVQKWCLHEWETGESELTRERGLWGPEVGSVLDKFQLDMTEGPSRVRRKMIPNPQFYRQYPYRPNLDLPESKALRSKFAISKDSKVYYERMKIRHPLTMDNRILDTTAMPNTPSEEKVPMLFSNMQEISASLIRRVSIKNTPSMQESEENAEGDADDFEDSDTELDLSDRTKSTEEISQKSDEKTPSCETPKEAVANGVKTQISVTSAGAGSTGALDERPKHTTSRGPDNQTLLRLLEQGEQLHSMFRCARIQGLDTSEGLLLFGKEHYYVVDGFTLLKTREIRDLDFLPEELHDPIVPYLATGATGRPVRTTRLCSKFSYDDIREVHKRRYLLQPIALEVFSADGRNYLLAFPRRMRNRVYQKLVSMAKALMDGGSRSVSGQKASMSMELSGRAMILNSLIGQQSVTQKWVRGEITNFQYLMHLNTLAGRSYNDLSQYPVLPWILKDYDSEYLDLTNPNTFRDLSNPMGAQTPERLEQFLKRYREWDDPTGETPPYMYGTHYSSAMIVVSYLVRLEPFTQQFLKLQGGHFDLADRMFHCVKDAWLSASKNNMADVKELIPEFFTMPMMFLNKNNFDFGVKQNGVMLDDVILPAWAKNDPIEFVRLHREALECDYVSAHLHEWIDLIFGYRQHGEASIEANNLYHHLFYEGNVDFDAIEDPLTRNATIGFINNFGQIPTQLFKKPHPQKKVQYTENYSNVPGITTQRLFYHALENLKPPPTPFREQKSAVGSIIINDKNQVTVLEQNKILVSPTKFMSWGFPDRSIRMGSLDSDKSVCILETCDNTEMTCVACVDVRTIVSGSTTGTITVWALSEKVPKLRVKKFLNAHTDAVTALIACSAHTVLVSASRDTTAILWHMSTLTFIRQLRPHPGPVSAVAINENTGDIATAAGTYLLMWTINGQLLSIVNTVEVNTLSSSIIISLAFTTLNDWDVENVVMCGTNDGMVKMYSQTMVESEDCSIKVPDCRSMNKEKIACAADLHERLNRQRGRLRGVNPASTHTYYGKSLDSMSTKSFSESQSTSPEPPESPFTMLNEDSDDIFEVITSQHNSLSGDRRWQRVLVLRTTLTMHTAFARKENPQPAPVTCLTPSRDHKSLFVGDGIGRVWLWTMGPPGGSFNIDNARLMCNNCKQKLSLVERRYTCKNCGQNFCSKCSRYESEVKVLKVTKPARLCQPCFARLKNQAP
ncbi:hypothetical protein QR680_003241 [Steinernema hermaphroditum]|uniref:WD repeat and FYVE domain-containing protein 3 n=1 Tax=Steinernema hermaphroditum TaxID=289476 RepID=A0AA39LJB5_9BILA|nr:hypothetical protein QR680_003241 [Steinernema hermaphroditum]